MLVETGLSPKNVLEIFLLLFLWKNTSTGYIDMILVQMVKIFAMKYTVDWGKFCSGLYNQMRIMFCFWMYHFVPYRKENLSDGAPGGSVS